MKPPETAVAESASRRPRYRLTGRDWARSLVFLATAIAFAVSPLLVLLLVFSLFFNAVTIHLTLFFFGLLAFVHGFTEYRNRLAVSGTATATANSAAIGLVEMSGRGFASNSTEAPVSGKLCAYWTVEVRHRGKNDFRLLHGLWNRVMKRSSGDLDTIELADDTGRLLVWARGAEMVPIREVWRSDRGGDPPQDVVNLIAALGLQWPSRWDRHPMKVTEERLEQGGPLYVMGTLAERCQIRAASKSAVGRLLDRWATPDLPSEEEGTGSLASTFVYARKIGLRWFAKDLRPLFPAWAPPDVDQHQVLLWKGDQRRPFIVSGVLEPQALRALSRRAWLYLLCGAGVMAWTLWEFLEKLTGNMRW